MSSKVRTRQSDAATEYEDQLVGQARVGSEDAFAELTKMYSERVYRIAYRITGNHYDAEDAAQDTYLKAYKHLQQFQGDARFGTWLFRIAFTTSLMILRKRRVRNETPTDPQIDEENVSPLREFADRRPNPSEVYQQKERYCIAREIMAELPYSLREAAEMVFIQDLSIKEIGRKMGLPTSTVKSRLVRARRHMARRALADPQNRIGAFRHPVSGMSSTNDLTISRRLVP